MTIVWYRNDLRTTDYEPLYRAGERGAVVAVYCVDPRHFRQTEWGFEKTGAFRAAFLLEGLHDLRRSLRALGSDLVVRQGLPEEILPALARQLGAGAVLAHREATREELDVEAAVAEALHDGDAALELLWGHTLYHLDDLPFAPADMPDVFTPFRKQVERKSTVRSTLPAPDPLSALPAGVEPGAIPSVDALGLALAEPDDRGVLPFKGGERAAMDRLNAYLWETDALREYKETRNGLLGADYSSKLSPWLAHGCLSPRTVHEAVKRYEAERVANESTYWLIFELIWRDFFRFAALKSGDRLFYPSGPMNRDVDWRGDDDAFQRWASGTTGYPFVDANMRELNATGFMSNRGRQNAASFLTDHLQVDWRRGAAYFERQLIDYDVTSNWGNWAYVAGVGHDPRNGLFNVVKQAHLYDPEAAYIKHWVPELQTLPTGAALEPYTLSPMAQQMHGFTLGDDYPRPILDPDVPHRQFTPPR